MHPRIKRTRRSWCPVARMIATNMVGYCTTSIRDLVANLNLASKSIDHFFHLQQVVPNLTAATTSKATNPGKKPIRQQPKGLKMRFHPIGFGTEEAGRIGSTSPSASDVEMEDGPSLPISRTFSKPKNAANSDRSSSDKETDGAPPISSKLHAEAKIIKSSRSGISQKEPSLKRKHSEGGEKKSKHSSSSISQWY